MSQFLESEAEESDDETLAPRKRKFLESDDDEEEEDDEEKLREEMKDLINDDAEEEEEDADSDESDSKRRKRKDSEDEYDDRLEDDDYDLLEENLGVKVQRKKFKRLRRVEDDDSEDDDNKHEEQEDRQAIANELFEGSDEEKDKEPMKDGEREQENEYGDLSDSEGESDPDDFIVDDDGQPIHKQKKKRHVKYHDAALQEAQDIFGVDFDFEEINQYNEYDEEFEEYEEDEGGESEKRSQKKSRISASKKSIYEIYEPIELERNHFTDRDNEIRANDVPERFQLRAVPVTAPEEGEIEKEAEWIYKYAFSTPPLSNQDNSADPYDNDPYLAAYNRKPVSCIPKIREALTFIREFLEVPFIAFYRKEYIEPDLNINDLWTIYECDGRWCQLRKRKANLMKLFRKMQDYQCDELLKDPDAPVPDNMKLITDKEIQTLSDIQTVEELKDFYAYFLLHYSKDIEPMNQAYRKSMRKKKELARIEREKLGDGKPDVEKLNSEEIDDGDDDADGERVKYATRKDAYTLCNQYGLDAMVKKFGMSAENFGENLRDNYQRHEVEQYPIEPLEAAKEHLSRKFPKPEDVLAASCYMAAQQISRDPIVRQCVRETFYERAKISVRPTKKGIKEIDENHPCYSFKYLKNKHIKDLMTDQYLHLHMAEEEKLIEMTIGIDGAHSISGSSYVDEIKQLYQKDEFSNNVQKWNAQRNQILDVTINKILYPIFIKEVRSKLLVESRNHVTRCCRAKLYHWLKVSPFQVDQQVEDDEDFDTREGIRVFGIAYVPDRSVAAFGAMIDGDGEVTDFIRLPNLLKRKDAFNQKDRAGKEADLMSLRKFLLTKKPHVVCVCGESRDAQMIIEDVRRVVDDLVETEQFPPLSIELVNNEYATLYMNSAKSEAEFRDYPPLLRQAISLARQLQDPLQEFSQLCIPTEEILCMKYHYLQDQVPKEELLSNLYLEFINRTNEVGVDVDMCIDHPHASNILQFVSGLGPRKASSIIKTLKQGSQRLENRMQLVTVCHMGPKVFVNCAGFIKIDTNAMADADAYVEVLDGSRVHPEMYEWARKMAIDALDYDDENDVENPAAALDEILESPERLKDLDLDAFAAELKKQGFGNKSIALYDIRAELNHRYKDLRTSFRSATAEEKFNMLTKEHPRTFHVGKLILARVYGIAHRKPKPEQLDKGNPIRNDEQNLWQCPFCMKNDFPDLSEVWNHFDAGSCPGQAMGVKVRLDNGCTGFIQTKNISDKPVKNPEERVQNGMTLHCRITKIDIEKFNVDLTCRSSDLADKHSEFRPPKDVYYDFDAEEKDIKVNEDSQKKKSRQTYIKRVIVHPSFHNINFKDAEKLLVDMDQGEAVVRPSSKGADHLTVTWKVHDATYQHIDVKEQDKENAFSLGQSLHIQNEEFEDLDEIIARHVQPMAAFARDLITYKYFRDAEGGKKDIMEQLIMEEKKKQPTKIHYLVSASKEFPGKFIISYLPRNKVRHEYITVTPEGFRFRQQIFPSLSSLLRWFKEHFRDPIPGSTPQSVVGMRTPMGQSSYIGAGTTPSINLANVNPEAIQRAAANLPSHVFNTLSQVAGQTPSVHQNYGHQPYTPSQPVATPLMTPSYPVTTPRYQPTPQAQSWPTPMAAQTPSHYTPHHNQPSTPRHGMPQSRARQPPATPIQNPNGTPQSSQKPPTPNISKMSSQQASRTVADWKKMAEQWAKKQQKEQTKLKSPGPDSTPLIDEH